MKGGIASGNLLLSIYLKDKKKLGNKKYTTLNMWNDLVTTGQLVTLRHNIQPRRDSMLVEQLDIYR